MTKEKLRILQIAPRYAPAWSFGGGVRISYEIAKSLVKRGHEVVVYTSDSIDARTRSTQLDEVIDGIRVIRFRNWSNYLASRYSFLFYRPVGLKASLSSEELRSFDIVHVVEARGQHNRWIARAANSVPPIVWSPYGGCAPGTGVRRIYRYLHDRVFDMKRQLDAATALVAQTDHEADILLQLGASPPRVRVIPLAVNCEFLHHLPTRGQLRRALGLSERKRIILFVGRVSRVKGLHLLLRAFAGVHAVREDVVLLVVGDDYGYLKTARKQVCKLGIQADVFFLGGLYGQERFKAYVDADVFALTPDWYEETSLAALEASACGTPCVLTRQCEIPSLEAIQAGWIVEPTPDSIQKGLTAALEPEGRVRGERARNFIRHRFEIREIAQQYESLFMEIVERI